MLMVTCPMGFAGDTSGRVCFFYDGKVEGQGPAADLFGNPWENGRGGLKAVKQAVIFHEVTGMPSCSIEGV